jgi:hypothetical protein
MMELSDLVIHVSGFDSLPPREKIRLFAWFLHTHRSADTFDLDGIRRCYKQLHLVPDQISTYVNNMVNRKPPDLIMERGSYKLTRAVRSTLDSSYGLHQTTVAVSKLLLDLPNTVPDLAERAFLSEALKCYRVEAYRACIVMAWNLAFDHLLRWILKDAARIASFNLAIPKRFPKKPPMTVVTQDDFEELKESETIEVCNTAGLLSGNIVKILREKLIKRNMAAHPSGIVIVQSQADDVVTDLVNNVVLALT